MSISGFVALFAIVAIPRPEFTPDIEPAFAVVFTVTLPVPPLNVIFPPAAAKVTPVLFIVTPPVGLLTDIAVPAITLSTSIANPGTFAVTLKFAAVAVIPFVKSIELTFAATAIPLDNIDIELGVGPGNDQVLSPLKKVVLSVVPVADIFAPTVPVTVIGPPVTLI